MNRIDGRPRRSLLYIPGNNPGMIQNCAIYGSDGVLLDLEDSISVTEKDAARKLVKHALKTLDFGSVERVVRINGRDTPFFERDLEEIIPARPDAVRIPKIDSPDDIRAADDIITRLEEENGMERGFVRIHAMLETARAIVNASAIASSSPRILGLTIGGQDLAADLGIKITKEGLEMLYARSAVVLAAKAAGLLAFDTVYTDIDDLEGLREQAAMSVALGFSGKAAVHPSQIAVIHEAFRPEEKDVRKAERIVRGAREAEERGLGVVAVDGRMVDAPVVAQARRTLELARLAGMEVETE
ncbi:aldolase/citrate lyase family protein [Aminivibrio sp.]|jgi:citrate lyase subunit beta/citryl-CoA lyase|uniref:HpcH/HpaI aldolase/citrate lyase family protein n=1 Tax=Aminivibrio sp. TaxID=1872489 RepID=UPI001A3F9AAE|nr:aldolase/citrate lyase family protein [Aminivibrio sp.]MBL3540122.1 HpcH/HpaI aldolase/citrate lyase family protein [Aminivibrio sp.]MDK2958501.1 citrate lyase subunit beta / citryl-CoA lyase [Synergistaceae bacterium]